MTDERTHPPYLTHDVPAIDGVFRAEPADFVVEEIPAYEPSGEGEHVFAWIEKRELNTPDAVNRLARVVGASPRDCGWAGLKDRHAITRQWVSFYKVDPSAVQAAQVDGVRVLRVAPHPQKLRTGHLRGNRFQIRVRQASGVCLDDVHRVMGRLQTQGMPNYFGEQRFGYESRNWLRAHTWIATRGHAPRGRFERKLWMSAFQAELFNRCVAERLPRWNEIVAGDLLKKEDTGGLFVSDDLSRDQARADAWELSPTGPIFGAKMRWPQGAAEDRERALLRASGVDEARLNELRRCGAGSRRVLRVRPAAVEVDRSEDGFMLAFTLPKGSYATVVLREILKKAL